jgi:hypothetical protein
LLLLLQLLLLFLSSSACMPSAKHVGGLVNSIAAASLFFFFLFRLWLRPFCKNLLIVWKKERNTKTLTREVVVGECRRGLTLQVRTWGRRLIFFLSFFLSFFLLEFCFLGSSL